MNLDKLYKTEFKNDRETPVRVDENIMALLWLAPGEEKAVEQWSPYTTYARYSRVLYNKDGSVSVVYRNGFPSSEELWPDQYVIECINYDGADPESLAFGGERIVCPRGIPVYAPISLNFPLVFYKRIEWKLVRKRVPMKMFTDYITWEEKLEMIKTRRSKREIKAILRTLRDRDLKSTLDQIRNSRSGILDELGLDNLEGE